MAKLCRCVLFVCINLSILIYAWIWIISAALQQSNNYRPKCTNPASVFINWLKFTRQKCRIILLHCFGPFANVQQKNYYETHTRARASVWNNTNRNKDPAQCIKLPHFFFATSKSDQGWSAWKEIANMILWICFVNSWRLPVYNDLFYLCVVVVSL